jgi:type II pantothenate kinase
VEEADLTRAVLVMVLNNVAQVAHSSSREHGIDRILFGGSFLRRGTMMRVVTSALKFWSAGRTRAAFMQHDGYFGAMGTLCLAAESDDRLGLPTLVHPASKEYVVGGPHGRL